MKIIILIICAFCLFQTVNAQIKVKVDERYELVSVTFSLAGVPQFCDIAIPEYKQSIIDDLNNPYTLTEPIHFVRKLAQEHAIGYDAVSTAASMLEIKNGKIRLNPKYKIEQIAEFDKRWTVELFEEYIKQLNVFYKQSKFHNWFEKHQPLYELAEKRFNDYFASSAMAWFKSFYGSDLTHDMNLYISCVNGPHNYSTPEGILLGVGANEKGEPSPNQGTMSLLTHEIGHHYVNPLVDKYWAQMEVAANKIYTHVKDQMAKIAYGNAKTTMIEWLNNLFVLMYFKEIGYNGGTYFDISSDLYRNMMAGFIWMPRSVEFMGNFYANRDKYPIIEEFMPQLIGFLNFTADNFDLVQREFDQKEAYITNIYPAPSSDLTNVTEITLTFSEEMNGSCGFLGCPENTLQLPIADVKWSDDRRKVKITLTPGIIVKGQTYGLRLSGRAFQNAKHFSLDQRFCDLVFKQPLR